MSDAEILADAVRRIDAFCHPREVWLFGSRARGDAREDSDFDLAVVVDKLEDKYRLEAKLYGVLREVPAAIDVIAFEAGQWARWRTLPVTFEPTITHEGSELLRAA
jgi:predicted nucleotidyltransferase